MKAVFVDDSPQVDPLIGATLDDRYRVTDRIGEGGMGAVYKAEQITMGRPVALKVLRPELASDPDIVKRFLREVKAISMLSHPNLITVHDFGQTDAGLLYIAMEYLGGDTLTDAIKRGPLPIAECLRLVAEIASAMAEAHSKGVIHRDLKPDNVMLVERGDGVTRLKVLDFGIAKITDGTAHTKITRAGFAVGTPAYMSPEQASASPDITHSADLYALGCIFYQMLTSRAPFHGYTEMGVLLAHCNEDPERPSAAAPHLGIPPEVDDVVMWTLEKKPKNRPGSATSLIRRLEAIRVEFLHGGRGAAGIPAAGDAATASMVSVTPLGAEHDDDAGPTAAMSSLEPGRATTPEVPGARRVGTPAPPPSVASSPTPHALRAPVAETPDAQAGLTRDVIELARGDSKGRKGLVIAIVLLVLSGLATLVALGGKGDPAQPAAATASPAALAGAAAPETTPAAPAARKVWMRSTPTGAELVEDGQVLGLTPLEMELPKGPPRRLRLRLADYETIEVSLDSSMTSGRDVALTPKPAPKRRRPKAKARPKSRRKAAKAKAEPKPDAPKPAGDDDMFKLR